MDQHETRCTDLGPADRANSDCPAWVERQTPYREQLRRLFVRHWELTPSVAYENYASEAYRRLLTYITNRERADLEKLQPSGGPSMDTAQGVGFSYFEILIKWSDFPPINRLQLAGIHFALDLCSANGVCSSTAPDRKGSDPATFGHLSLERTRTAMVSACNYPLEVRDPFGVRFPAWYFLTSDGSVSDVFGLENYAGGGPGGPTVSSPIPVWTLHFSKSIGKREVVCGPEPRYVVDGKPAPFETKDHRDLDPDDLTVQANADGTHLLRNGPTVGPYGGPYGRSECAGCPKVALSIYRLSPTAGATLAFQTTFRIEIGNRISDGDIRFSPDWRSITVYQLRPSDEDPAQRVWASNRYCPSGDAYTDCGSGPSGPPPNPRVVHW